MSVSNDWGRFASDGMTTHYRGELLHRHPAVSYRIDNALHSLFKEGIGYPLYIAARGACRVAALGIRATLFVGSIFVGIARKDPNLIAKKFELMGLTALRLIGTPIQFLIGTAASVFKAVSPAGSSAEKFCIQMLYNVHRADEYFDKLEYQIAGELDPMV